MEYALALSVLLVLVVAVLARPYFGAAQAAEGEAEQRAELEAAKQAKYREIRDAELDYRTGKLSDSDYRRTDRELRAQAIDLLRRIDRLG